MHILLNSTSYDAYETLKEKGPPPTWTPEDIETNKNIGSGTATLFHQVVEKLIGGGKQLKTLRAD